jgi:hypothetical protein
MNEKIRSDTRKVYSNGKVWLSEDTVAYEKMFVCNSSWSKNSIKLRAVIKICSLKNSMIQNKPLRKRTFREINMRVKYIINNSHTNLHNGMPADKLLILKVKKMMPAWSVEERDAHCSAFCRDAWWKSNQSSARKDDGKKRIDIAGPNIPSRIAILFMINNEHYFICFFVLISNVFRIFVINELLKPLHSHERYYPELYWSRPYLGYNALCGRKLRKLHYRTMLIFF